tara:strand:- start:583 stop:717 length:135 start_codon:yes stop_codon:yes gene_type:complete
MTTRRKDGKRKSIINEEVVSRMGKESSFLNISIYLTSDYKIFNS